MPKTTLHRIVPLAGLMFTASLYAAEPVMVGKGSYASEPPAEAENGARKAEGRELFLVNQDDRPIPSNKWWTQLVVDRFAKSLWVYPMKLETSDKGATLFSPTRWQPEGNDPASEFPLIAGGAEFKPQSAKAKDWSDWLVSFRMAESDDKYFDVTLGEGMPYAWIEYHGVDPILTLPNGAKPKFFDKTGKPITAKTAKVDALGIEFNGRQFGVFAPDGTSFSLDEKKMSVAFAGKSTYLVICPLPSNKDIATFYKYAFAIPRDTRLSWDYDAAKGAVTTTWTVTTESLKGNQKDIIQGWLPHHWRDTQNDLKLAKLDYLSPRGLLKCATGSVFKITFPYNGIVPNLPVGSTGNMKQLQNQYQRDRMKSYLQDLAGNTKYGEDTYWGGKDILRMGQAALMAQQTNDENKQVFVDGLHTAMADWFSYEPGENAHFFMHYPKWKALVGYKFSYGSEAFNDHHFHYGYFTQATALLAAHDPGFLKEYGEMAKLVAKEYANWDHADTRFPFMRTFDAWAGHGWAGGTSSQGGNNEESSSEDVQAWAGLIYLGQAMNDKDMVAAGVMGYAMTTKAVMEYWFDINGDVFPKEWKHSATGMVWGGGKVFGTYFTGDAAWVYGINWLPATPALSYLVRDYDFAKKSWDNMIRDTKAQNKPATIKSFGPALGSVMLGYALMFDPDFAAKELDDLYAEPGDKVAHDAREMAIMYYMTHAMRSLGKVDWKCHTTSATSMVFVGNDDARTRTYVVWNPLPTPQKVDVYEGTKKLGSITAAPGALTSTKTLAP